MLQALAQTSWRGLQIQHPHEWELTRVSGLGEPGRCLFADRYFQRMDVRWRDLTYVPKLELIVSRYMLNLPEGVTAEPLADCPPHWAGVVRTSQDGRIVHAARYFRATRWLVEVTVVWPGDREVELEHQILASVDVDPPGAPRRLWRAMGLAVSMDRGMELQRSTSHVGRVEWTFTPPGKSEPHLRVQRLAMPKAWLDVPLREWMKEDMPDGHRLIREEMAVFNSHRGERLITSARAGTVSALRGLRKLRLDQAWECPGENRLYRLTLTQTSRDDDAALPEGLEVQCCQKVPQVVEGGRLR